MRFSQLFLFLAVVDALNVAKPGSVVKPTSQIETVKPIIWVDHLGGKAGSGLVELCKQSIERAPDAQKYDIRFVTDENIKKYLPNVRKQFAAFSKATKTKYAKKQLTKAFGGVFIGGDVAVMRDLKSLVKKFTYAWNLPNVVSLIEGGSAELSGDYLFQPLARYEGEEGCSFKESTLVCGDKEMPDFFQSSILQLSSENHKEEFNAHVSEFTHGAKADSVAGMLFQHTLNGADFLDVQPAVVGARCYKPGLNKEKPRKELDFIHIPRTGGTTVEDCSRRDRDLTLDKKWGAAGEYVALMNKAFGQNPIRDLSATTGDAASPQYPRCYTQHVPPAFAQDRFKGKDTFCSVRNPYTRVISEFGFKVIMSPRMAVGCTKEELNKYVKEQMKIAETPAGKYVDDCHFLPQSMYVYNVNPETGKLDTKTKLCKKVMKFENLAEDFNAHMEKHGYPYSLAASHHAGVQGSAGTQSPDKCQQLKPSDLSAENVKLIQELYKDDFELLGYSKDVPN